MAKRSRTDGDDGTWSVRYSVSASGIPDYDAERDPNVPFTKTDKFRKHMREIRADALHSQTTGPVLMRSKSSGSNVKELEGVAPPSSMRPMDALLSGSSTANLRTNSAGGGLSHNNISPRSKYKVLGSPPGSANGKSNTSQSATLSTIRGPKSTSTLNGGITIQDTSLNQYYGREDTVAPEKELEVLKAILLREGYLTRVAEVASSKEASKTVPPALPDLLDLLRIASVEVVEVIAQWRQAQAQPLPFDWNGINYLLKMPSDLDFLSTCRPLVSWLGFDLERNPFAVPLPLEQYRANHQAHGGLEMSKTASGVDGFTNIGLVGNVNLKKTDDFNKDTNGGRTKTMSKQGGGLEGRPYAAAVVNDQTLIPPMAQSKPSKEGGSGNSSAHNAMNGGGAGAGTTTANFFGRGSELASSQILDVDMLRVREAEKILLAEESKRGRWTRAPDNSGRIVPASQAEADLFLKDMGLDDMRPAVEPAYSSGHAPFAETGGMGLAKRDINGFIIEAPPLRANADKQRLEEMANTKKRGGAMPGQGGEPPRPPDDPTQRNPASSIPGRAKGKRTGGELSGMTVASTMGRRKAPVRRSRGARLDEELIRARKEVSRLENELSQFSTTLAQAEHDLAHYASSNREEDEEKDAAVQLIQKNARGKVGRDRAAELKRRKEEVEQMQAERARRKEEVAARQRELKFKEEQHIYYKQHQKREQDRKRAAALERKRRLLDEGEVLPEDEENAVTLEDVSAAAIQRIARGRSARHYAKALKESYAHAATIIEAGARGMFSRRVVRLMRRKIESVIKVQCQVRGMIGRIYAKRLASQREQERCASTIARIYRGLAGRIRHARKRMLFEASKGAALVVDVKHLYPADLMELSEAIAKPLVDASIQFPPPAVLGLIRIVVCILQCEQRGDTVTAFNSIGVKAARKLKSTTLGWEDGMRVLRRSHKLLRQLRQLSAGPASRRPRLLHIPREALELMAAYGDDPIMTVSNMRRIGAGAKASSHLLAWVKDLVTVHELQRYFLDEIGDVLPGWVSRQRNRHKQRRAILLNIAVYDRAETVASDCVQASKTAGEAWGGPEEVRKHFEMLKIEAKNKLVEIDKNEKFIRAKEEAEEKRNEELDVEAVRYAARDLDVKRSEYAEKKERAERGGKAEELLLPSLLSDIQSATVVLSEMETRLRLSKLRQAKDQVKRREWFEQPHEVRFKAAQYGEAQALFKVATVERSAEVAKIGGELYLRSLKGRAAGQMQIHDTRIAAAETRLKECEEDLNIANRQFEKELELLFEEERRREAEPGDWAKAAQEELEEDAREDEMQAHEEAERARFFVPKNLLEIAPTRPRPLLVCISRDVSGCAKKEICAYLCKELPGMFVQVSSVANHGVDIDAFQRVLSTGQSILCEVDVGISEAQRGAFLSALSVAKRALIPSPYAVLAIGDVRNRRGSTGDEYLGCSEFDLRAMSDGILKRRLETAAESISALSSSQKALDQINLLSKLGEPPSRAHAAVLEAAIILLTPTNRFRGPSDGVAGMAWAACRLLLADPVEFVQRLREVDPCNIPPANLDVIQMYIGKSATELVIPGTSSNGSMSNVAGSNNKAISSKNEGRNAPNSLLARMSGGDGGGWQQGGTLSGGGFVNSADNSSQQGFSAWPSLSSPQRDASQFPVMAHLIEWIEAVASFARELAAKGGAAKPVTKRYPRGLFAAVVPVRDATTKIGEYDEMSLRGWSAASVSMLAPILEDMRVHREAIKLNGTLHSVNVYRDCHRIFFSAYDPVSSLYRTASIAVSRVNQLLAPNSVESSEFASKGAPTTPEALYRRLVELLSIESVRSVGTGVPVKRMVCRRKLTLLMRETRKISGHMATVTVYEEAKGELRSHVYLPEFCAAIELNCGGKTLSNLFPHADDHWEKPHLASQEAMRLLGPITDRLEIHPSKREIKEMGFKPKDKVGLNPSDAPQASRHQGFQLKLRPKGGPGRLLLRKLCTISGVQHLLTVREFGRGGLLRIRVYEPLSSVEREIRLSPTQRVALLGSDSGDDWRSWIKPLQKRLSLKRRAGGAFGLHISKLLCRSAVRINRGLNNGGEGSHGLLVAVVIYLDDGDGSGNAIRLACQRPGSQEEFSFLLTNGEVGDLLKCREVANPIKDVLCNHKNVKAKKACFEKILAALNYDEEEDEVVLATPGSVKADITYVADEDTGLNISIISIKETALASSNADSWVKRARPLPRPLVLEETPPPPIEGFGMLRPLPVRGGSVEEVSKARKQPPIVRYEHAATETGSYKYEPAPAELTMEQALLIAQGGKGGAGGEVPFSSPTSSVGGGGSKSLDLHDGAMNEEGYRRVVIDVHDTLVPSSSLQRKFDEGMDPDKVDREAAITAQAARRSDLVTSDSQSVISADGEEEGNNDTEDQDEGMLVLRNQRPIEGNESKKLALLLAPEQDNALNTREGERCVFNQAVKIHVGEVPELSFESTMIVKVFEFYNQGMEQVQRNLRFAIYDPSTSTVADVVISGDVDLRETVGPHAQHLFDPTNNNEREAALYYHIARWRATVVRGLWDEDKDCYEVHGDRFTIVLKKERLYSIDKQTPLHSSGGMDVSRSGSRPSSRGSTSRASTSGGALTALGKDGNANMDKLIDDATKRGVKILRQGLAVDGVLMHLTVFELVDDDSLISKPKRKSSSRMSAHKKNSAAAAGSIVTALKPTHENLDEDASLDSRSLDDGENASYITSDNSKANSSYADDSVVRSKAIKFKSNGEEKDEQEIEEDYEEEGEDEPIPPTLRIVGYNPKTGHKSLVVVPPQAVLEVLVNNPSDMSPEEILTRRKRHFLARYLTSKLRLEYPRNAPPELVIPWSGANFGFLGEVAGSQKSLADGKLDKNNGRPIEERPLKRKNRVMRCSMQICKLNVVVTAFRSGSGESNAAASSKSNASQSSTSDLSLNLYYGHIQESCELLISSEEMTKRLGRNVFELDEGEPRNTAIEWLCRRLKIEILPDPDIPSRKILKASLEDSNIKDWVAAYKQLDPTVPVAKERIEGIPMKFIPSNSRGDLVLRKGIKIKGAKEAQRGIRECLVSVYTRAVSEPANHGLVFECYNADTAYTAILHVEASELRRQVCGREELLMPMQVKDTIESLLYRLVLTPSPVGGLSLSLDIKQMPNLFDD